MPPPSGRSVLPTFRGTALKQIPHTSANSHFGNPLTKNYVHPSSSPQPGPPPTWKPLAKFGGPLTSELPPPSTLDAEGLGHAANTAARDRVKGTSPYWQQLKDRALAIAPAMEPRDCALLLNAFSRVRLCDQQLFDTLAPVVEAKLLYFTSVHLAMVFSAFAKTGESFLSALSREVGARVHEFHSPVEICMLLNAMTKLGLVDLGLFTRWSKHVQARMSQEPFHVRDLSVIASALARVIKHHTVAEGGRQKKEEEDSTAALNAALDPLTDTMDLIAGRALATLGEATPMELARLLLAFTSDSGGVIIPPKQLLESSLECARDKLMFMAPAELVNVAFAFGQVRESLTSASDIALLDASIFERLRFSAVSSAPLFLASEVAGLLQVYSRERREMTREDREGHLEALVEALVDLQAAREIGTAAGSSKKFLTVGVQTIRVARWNSMVQASPRSTDTGVQTRVEVSTAESQTNPVGKKGRSVSRLTQTNFGDDHPITVHPVDADHEAAIREEAIREMKAHMEEQVRITRCNGQVRASIADPLKLHATLKVRLRAREESYRAEVERLGREHQRVTAELERRHAEDLRVQRLRLERQWQVRRSMAEMPKRKEDPPKGGRRAAVPQPIRIDDEMFRTPREEVSIKDGLYK
ncbi:hypothetical protein FOZ62_021411 [Perkinsus olseni]|uniref:Uncharacterized protein n=1 Tax=Perkinsus olseni TaxID=32597 RepID=A0A7J6TWY8_PEROL|nr:hypothetical protein FOZ62_021411 [Perkinsus olseni]